MSLTIRDSANGIERLVQKFKQDFRRENLAYYSGEDYARAERGYIQFCLKHGGAANSSFGTST